MQHNYTKPIPRDQAKKGHKLKYQEQWQKELLRTVPVALLTPIGDKLRKMRSEIRREHQTRKEENHD